MVLKIGEQTWHLHFHTSLPSDKEALWDVVVKCLVHTGECIWTHLEPKYYVNGAVGVANCSKRDRFDGSVDYRLALTRAYWARMRKPRHQFDHTEAASRLLARLGLSRLELDPDAFGAIQAALANAYAAGMSRVKRQKAA